MKFYNREQELSSLSEIAELSKRNSHFVVVTGRRRVGKTELIRHFLKGRKDFFYFFVSRKKSHILLMEFQEVLIEQIPILASTSFKSLGDFFLFLFNYMKEHPTVIIFDEFQNFEFVDPSVFSIFQNLWDQLKDEVKGTFIFVGSIFTLMQKIFEGRKEPLYGRATSKLLIEPLQPDVIQSILSDYHVDAATHLPFFYGVFGGIPKYYFLLDRYMLFGKSYDKIIEKFYCEENAPLRNEGKELLIEEFGKNYHLYFSILEVVAGGETQMARIADGTGINVNSISKYLEELTAYYQILERRVPITDRKHEKKLGRYYIKDPALKFWFRYVFRHQSLLEIGDVKNLLKKISSDLPTFLGRSFEELVRALLLKRNSDHFLPFKFTDIGGFWTKRGDEIDIVALDEDKNQVLFGECKLNGERLHRGDILKFKEKANFMNWKMGKRTEYFSIFSAAPLSKEKRKMLSEEKIMAFELGDLLKEIKKT
ncbi:MAG: ATP-binding protein [Chlamydiae bacterium]|nr:ATP-binding protein [Chlamydiota bacterium]